MWKWILGILLLLAVLLGVGGYFTWKSEGFQKQWQQWVPGSKPTQVRLESVAKGELSRTVAAPGQIEAKTNVKISAQVSARIIALPFRENDQVKKGDVIVRLDAADLEALLQASEANLRGEQARFEGSQAAMARARSERDRVKKLNESGDVAASALEQAESEYLRAQSNLRSSEHAIEAARAQIIRARKDLENTTIISPIDGTITVLDAEVGELVVVGTLNNAGSVIMEIADLGRMVLKARVDESNVLPVKENQIAKVYINAYGERVFKGFVERVELQRKVDRDNTGYFEVWIPITLEAGEVLRSGLTANCDIEVETIRDAIVVPSQAVVDRKVDELPKSVSDNNAAIKRGDTYARVIYRLTPIETPGASATAPKKYKTVATPVTIGSSDLTRTVVLAGVKEGDLIVTGPFKILQSLRHDQEVEEERSETEHAAKPDAK